MSNQLVTPMRKPSIMNVSLTSGWRLSRLFSCAMSALLLLANLRVSATEVLQNGSFAAGSNGWQRSPELAAWILIYLPSWPDWHPVGTNTANLHPVHSFLGPLFSQDLNVPDVAGADLIAKITLSYFGGGPGTPTNTIAVYADYVDADGVTNRILLQNPANSNLVFGSATIVTNIVTLPASARTLVRYAVARLDNGSCESSGVSLDVETGIVHNGGFETGDLSLWTSSSDLTVATNLVAHGGSYLAMVASGLGQPSNLSQDLAARLTAGVEYHFSGWVYFTALGGPPMQFYGPFLRVSATNNLSAALPNGSVYATNAVLGWNELEFSRTFTADELAAPVYFGIQRNGGMILPLIDDLVVTAPAPVAGPFVWVSNPDSSGATLAAGARLSLQAKITNVVEAITHLEFFTNGVLLGEAQLDPHGEWTFPDGTHLSVMGWGNEEMIDFSPPAPDNMFFMNGSYSTPTNFSGMYQSFSSGGQMSFGEANIAFSFTANGELNASMTGPAPLGTRSLTPGTRGDVETPYLLWWPAVPPGNYTLTARASYGVGQSVTSAPRNITVSVTPPLQIRSLFGGDLELSWSDSGGAWQAKTKSDLGFNYWSMLSDTPQLVGGRYVQTVTTNGTSGFYRLFPQ